MNIGELAFLFVVALLVFGPRKLPEIARMLGKMMAELRRASNEFRHSLEEEIRNLEYQEQLKAEQAARATLPAETPAEVTPAEANPGEPPVQPTTDASQRTDWTNSANSGASVDRVEPPGDQAHGTDVESPEPRESVPNLDDAGRQPRGAYYGSYTASAAERGRGSSSVAAPPAQPEPWQTRERKW